ncbi:Scy1 protein kinase [Globisporangium polare]
MFNKFSSVVQTAVSGAVQGVLGEEFNKHYETPKDCTASGGHELSWKIFPAISRKSGQEVSIFVFDKDDLKKFKKKEHQERILEVLRQEMKTLRLLRHPHVLKVEEIFEESRRTLAFVTERVTCSLANACKNFTNVANVTPEVLEIGLTEFEVACGFMHIGEALSFLHREGRRVHLSLGPHSIFITPKGEWKLGGMGFCRVVEPGQTSRSEYYSIESSTGVKNPTTGAIEGSWEPPLEYCAPELVTEPRLFSSSADMFSLGLLVYELFVPPRADGGRNPVIDVRDGNPMTHGYKVQSLHPITFPPSIPVSLHNTIRALLSLQPAQRPEARMFLASQFFDSGPIKTLRTLQSLVEQDPASQAKFLTTLPEAIDGFSPRVLRDMVIPGLQSVVINKAVAPFVITPLLKIVAKVDKHIFGHSIAPMLIPLLAMTEPVQCMLMFVSELEVLIPKAEDGYIRDHIVPMLCRALDSTVPEILDTVLNKIVDQASLFEYRILKQVILPRVNKLILTPPQMSVRVNALLWMAKSFHVFDKDLLIESVLPTLQQTLQTDKSPAVCMCILGCYDNLGKHLGPEFVAKLIIPAVAPLLWEKTLNNSQFDLVCEKIQDMLKAVIQERDKVFTAESSVNSVTTGVTAASGFSEVIKAAEASKERATGVSAVNKMLSEEYVPEKKPEARKSDAKKPEPYSDDPFYLGSRRTQSGSGYEAKRNEPTALTREGSGDRSETFSSRRRAAKKSTSRSSRREKDDGNADLLNISSSSGGSGGGGSSGLLDLGGMQSSLPAATGGSNDLFNGMNLGGSSIAAPAYPSQNSMSFQGNPMAGSGGMQQAPIMNYGNQPAAATGGMGGGGQYNPSMMQMTPYGLGQQQQQPPQQQQQGYMSGSGGYGGQQQMNNGSGMMMMGNNNSSNNGLAGPGQMLQIQAAPGYHQQQQQQSSGDPWSAFDGL